jgi:hypothetical protein
LRGKPLLRPLPRRRRPNLEESGHVYHGKLLAAFPLRPQGIPVCQVVRVVVPAQALCLTRTRCDRRPARRRMRVADPPGASEILC